MNKFKGKVIYGVQKGRTLGFPTANIEVNHNLGTGIYAGYIVIDGAKLPSAIYSPKDNLIEAFILDFSENLYGKEVEIEIIEKIRDKKFFKNNAEAKEQISADVAKTKKILNNT